MDRAEIRRLADWYLVKTESEVTRHLVRERVLKPLMPEALGGGSPDSAAIRAARANIRQHMKYTNWLAGTRHWLAGPRITYADLAAAAALSVLDYLGEIDWRDHAAAREWYTRVKSRPSFRPLLVRPGAGPVPGVALCGPRFLSGRPERETLRQMIGREAKLAGFDAVAVTTPDAIPLAPARLQQFVAEGFHGSMGWIAETLERRGDPTRAVAGGALDHRAGMNYGPDRDPRGDARKARPRRDLRLCAEPRLSRRDQGPAEGDRRHASPPGPAAT